MCTLYAQVLNYGRRYEIFFFYFGCKIRKIKENFGRLIFVVWATTSLSQWVRGNQSSVPLALREPINHFKDCYFYPNEYWRILKEGKQSTIPMFVLPFGLFLTEKAYQFQLHLLIGKIWSNQIYMAVKIIIPKLRFIGNHCWSYLCISIRQVNPISLIKTN